VFTSTSTLHSALATVDREGCHAHNLSRASDHNPAHGSHDQIFGIFGAPPPAGLRPIEAAKGNGAGSARWGNLP
ncbi:MAG: hypothetical protein ACP5VR_02775, partial [Acidimicrobiales bacterium]